MKPNILFVSHKKTQCGVYEFGKSISSVLEQSSAYTFIRTECDSLNDLEGWMKDAGFKRVEKHDFLSNNFFVVYK